MIDSVNREPWHGTHDGYNNHRCRCEECTAARTAYIREWRAKTVIPERVHGTYNGYANYGCRCEGCRRVYSVAKAKRLQAKKDRQ